MPDTRATPRPPSIDWLASFPGIREHEPLAPQSWYGIGGRARYFLELSDPAPLPELVARLNTDSVPYLVIGAATNILFAAAEQPGLTIKLSSATLSMNGNAVSVAAGTLMPRLAAARLLEVQKHRRVTQPIEQRSLGSTFKNPPGDSAGRLIDAAGLKGMRVGGAQISPKHANFIVNLGGATADDVLALMAEMRDRVFERFGIELEPEVRIIGQAPRG